MSILIFWVTVNISIFRATFLFKRNLGLKYGRYCRGGFFYVSDSDIPVSSSKVTLRPYPYTVCPFKRGIYTVEDTKKSEFLGWLKKLLRIFVIQTRNKVGAKRGKERFRKHLLFVTYLTSIEGLNCLCIHHNLCTVQYFIERKQYFYT